MFLLKFLFTYADIETFNIIIDNKEEKIQRLLYKQYASLCGLNEKSVKRKDIYKKFWSEFEISPVIEMFKLNEHHPWFEREDVILKLYKNMQKAYSSLWEDDSVKLSTLPTLESNQFKLKTPPMFARLQLCLRMSPEELAVCRVKEIKACIYKALKLPVNAVLLAGYGTGSVIIRFYYPANKDIDDSSAFYIFCELKKLKYHCEWLDVEPPDSERVRI